MNEDTDAMLREAVGNQQDELARLETDETSFAEQIIQNFRGRRRWLSIVPFIQSFVFLAIGSGCGYQFYQAESTKSQIAWASGFMLAVISIALCKIWIWGEWQRNSLAREIKQLEHVVAELRDHVRK